MPLSGAPRISFNTSQESRRRSCSFCCAQTGRTRQIPRITTENVFIAASTVGIWNKPAPSNSNPELWHFTVPNGLFLGARQVHAFGGIHANRLSLINERGHLRYQPGFGLRRLGNAAGGCRLHPWFGLND